MDTSRSIVRTRSRNAETLASSPDTVASNENDGVEAAVTAGVATSPEPSAGTVVPGADPLFVSAGVSDSVAADETAALAPCGTAAESTSQLTLVSVARPARVSSRLCSSGVDGIAVTSSFNAASSFDRLTLALFARASSMRLLSVSVRIACASLTAAARCDQARRPGTASRKSAPSTPRKSLLRRFSFTSQFPRSSGRARRRWCRPPAG